MTTLRTIDLLPAPLRGKRRDDQTRAIWFSVLGATAFVVGAALAVVHGFVLPAGTPGVAEAARLRAEVDRVSRESVSMGAAVAATAERGRLGMRLEQRGDWSVLLAALDRLRGEGLALSSVAVAATSGTSGLPGTEAVVIVEGFAETQGTAQRYVLDLERSGLFGTVRLGRTTPAQAPGRSLTAFSIELRLPGLALDAGGSQ